MMASRYSVAQSSSVASLTRFSTACVASSPRISQPASISMSTSGLRCVAAAGAIDQQGLGCAADAGAPHLGVENDFLGHIERGRPVDIDVADAFQVREYRHARFRLHARDQAFAAARHDDVDIAVEPGQHQPDRGAVARRHELNGGFRQTGFAQAFRQRGNEWRGWSACYRSRRAGSRRCPTFRHSAPASAVTFGRLS